MFMNICLICALYTEVNVVPRGDGTGPAGQGPGRAQGFGRGLRRGMGRTGGPRPEVRRELLDADLVIPSLDAGSQEVFERVNRPCPELKIDDIIAGIEAFSSDFGGRLWMEVMLVKGVNDCEAELARISSSLRGINAEKIQLNTVERPPAEPSAKPLTQDEMERIRSYFDERAEIIAATGTRRTPTGQATAERGDIKAKYGQILSLLKRRPCTATDVANGLGLNVNEVSKLLGMALKLGLIDVSSSADGKTYFYWSRGK
ncbi:MAG: hypothetical protein H5T95_08770 [Firmicutes bacterium]|nr:hypothetical protein [Bacillota bacterium]